MHVLQCVYNGKWYKLSDESIPCHIIPLLLDFSFPLTAHLLSFPENTKHTSAQLFSYMHTQTVCSQNVLITTKEIIWHTCTIENLIKKTSFLKDSTQTFQYMYCTRKSIFVPVHVQSTINFHTKIPNMHTLNTQFCQWYKYILVIKIPPPQKKR